MTKERHAFLTGYPGFIARRLARKLLSADDALQMTLLTEASKETAARAALREMAVSSGIDPARANLLVGDVTAMDLALSGDEFRAVTARATEVYHLAAVHSVDADRVLADAVNVRGTANVLSFARAMARVDRFVHFSSAYVSGDRRGVIMERELEASQSFRNAYEATKFQAERLVRRAAHQLPIIIIRPAGVVGDSRTGEIDRFDSVYHLGMLLAGSPVAFPVPFAGEGHAPLNLIPVDYLIDAVHVIVNDPGSVGLTFHVVDPNPLSARSVYETIAERSGRKLPKYRVSPNLTKALLRIPGLERFAAVSHQAIDYLNNMAFYNSRTTMDVLDGTGIRCPQFEDYVDNLMQYVREYFERQGHGR